MSTCVQHLTPTVLQWARERKHLSPQDVADKVASKKVDADVIIAWEQGVDAPTYPQLEKIADLCKVPIAVFFFPEPPTIDDVPASFRSAPGFDFASVTHKTLNMIHRVQADQMSLKEINDGINPITPPLREDAWLTGIHNEDIHVLAKNLRGESFLDVSLEKQFGWRSYMEALDAWRDAVERQGIFVFRRPLKSDQLSGFCLYDDEFPVICINSSNEAKGRQIFTLLHELIHILSGESSVTLLQSEAMVTDSAREKYFDSVAGAMLVPLDDLKGEISRADPSDVDFYKKTSSKYKVTPTMLLVTCWVNKLISDDDYPNVAGALGGYTANDRGDGGGDYYWNQISYLGKSFLYNVLSKRHQNRISDYEVAQMLNMKLDNVHTLEGYLAKKA